MIVLHLIRKNTHLKASFIQNQITNHVRFKPHVVFCEEREDMFDGGFADHCCLNIPVYGIAKNRNIVDRFGYKYFKLLCGKKKRQLLEVVQIIKPDIIHLHYGTDAGIYLNVLKKINIPKVVSFYGYECSGFPNRFFGYGKTYLKNNVFRFADRIFAMSEDMKKDLLTIGCPVNKIIVHYHGSDVSRFYAVHNYSERGVVRFLIISGLVPQKGHSFLLEAFAQAYKNNKHINLTVVGAGELEEQIRQQVTRLGLDKVVILPGPVVYGSDQHKNYFETHDVFIHPSITDINGDKEGIPGAIVEAMAAGLPVISTYHAGIPFIIESEKSGLLVNENDANGLCDSIIGLAGSAAYRKQIGLAGQSFALSNLNIYDKEKHLEHIYQETINSIVLAYKNNNIKS